jgi:predicted amidohydrolase
MNQLRIALAQTRQTADREDNRRAILESIDKAALQDVQILCFPETQTVGYRVDISPIEDPIPVEWLDEVHSEVATRCGKYGMACILGTEMASDGVKPYNTAIVIDGDGRHLGAHHKTLLTPLDAVAYEPGTEQHTFDLFGVTVGVVICFEALRFAQTTAECVRRGAQIVFHPQNNTTRPNDWKIPIHHALIVTRAAENTVWFASCNACLPPHQNSRSLIVAPDGQVHGQTELKREEILVRDIDIDQATRAMFRLGETTVGAPGALEDSANLLFADTVKREEYSSTIADSSRNDVMDPDPVLEDPT